MKDIKLINIEEANIINKLKEEIKYKSEIKFAFKNPKELWGDEKEIKLENGEVRKPKFIYYNNGQSFIWVPVSLKRSLTDEEVKAKKLEIEKLEKKAKELENYIDNIKYNLENNIDEDKLKSILKDVENGDFKYVNYCSQIRNANGVTQTTSERIIITEWDTSNFIIVKTKSGDFAYIPSYHEEPYVYTDQKIVQKLEQLGSIWKTPNCSLISKEDFKTSLLYRLD